MYYPHYKNGISYALTLQCPNLDNQLTLKLLNDATVRGDIYYYDVCKVSKTVRVAMNNEPGWFEVDPVTETMFEFPVRPRKGMLSYIPWDWEIIQPFLDHHSLTPIWIDCHYVWGWPDETGAWTGAVGKVRNLNFEISTHSCVRYYQIERDEADWAIPNLGCTYGRSQVALCPHALIFYPNYWWTRYPQETSKFWNLINLFSPEAWMWTFLTLILITVTLYFASVLGSKLGLNVGSDEVALIPFRSFSY